VAAHDQFGTAGKPETPTRTQEIDIVEGEFAMFKQIPDPLGSCRTVMTIGHIKVIDISE
jgi:hypothetical protein